MYSESVTSNDGSTIGASDFVERLPLQSWSASLYASSTHSDTYVCFRCRAAKLLLTELYWLNLVLTSLSTVTSSCKSVSFVFRSGRRYKAANLLKGINEFADGLVGSVANLVPAKVANVVIGRFCKHPLVSLSSSFPVISA